MHKQMKDQFVEIFTEGYNQALEHCSKEEMQCWFDENVVPHQMWGIYVITTGDVKMHFAVNGSVLLDIFDVVATIEEKFNIKVNGFSTYCGKVEAMYTKS